MFFNNEKKIRKFYPSYAWEKGFAEQVEVQIWGKMVI